ncbi:PB1 domain [Dillenia turbinata]|uniref:PB1 domain n=1 Tax=Dillenia turbinata TaxID=194707 RepID=A0AAN8ZQ34_9MAGN
MTGEGERSAHSSAGNSPRGRVKFMCSYGGKILPRPGDGVLKYVGGETRIVAIPRDIAYSELKKKLGDMVDGDMILKYQILPEDLDALVSVKSDEDLRHMLDEYERQESKGTPKLRAFLFPANPPIENQMASSVDHPLQLEQRYIDAVNGIVHTPFMRSASFRPTRSIFTISSAGSSPKSNSPDAHTGHGMDSFSHGAVLSSGQTKSKLPMHKVRSSPSLCTLNNPQEPQNGSYPFGHYHPHHHHHPHLPYYRNHQHQHHLHMYQDFRPPDPHRSFSNLQPMSRSGHSQGHWCQSSNYIYTPTRESMGVDASVHHQNPYVDGRTFNISSSPPRVHGKVIWE